MFTKTLVCLALAGVALSALTERVQRVEWAAYKHQHDKAYTMEEDEIRFQLYSIRADYVMKHNARYHQGLETYLMEVNHLADWTPAEMRARNGYLQSFDEVVSEAPVKNVSADPASIDWTTKNVVTPVQDQGRCGSCWSFGTVGTIEGQFAKNTKKLLKFSESNLVDCDTSDNACQGGLPTRAYPYVIAHGLDSEEHYPYTPEKEKCKFNKGDVKVHIKGFKRVTGGEGALKTAVAEVGPIVVGIDASHLSFQLYKTGVYSEPRCSSTRLDHAVLVVGYGTENGKDFWKIKNSWSPKWGEQGFIKMARNANNMCGVATDPSYPTGVSA